MWNTYIPSTIHSLLEPIIGSTKPTEVIDHWKMSKDRSNAVVAAVLRDKETSKMFCIGNYHMPCAYYAPMVMTIHADMVARYVQDVASTAASDEKNNGKPLDTLMEATASKIGNQLIHSIPYVLAGDFNLKPSESLYKLLTTGDMSRDDPFFPTPKNGVEWTPTAQPMSSAYTVMNGKEPDYTNWARVKENEPFIDTLDYIFLSNSWHVSAVRPLLHLDDANHHGPYPNLDLGEPSDHVLISADIEL
jgi:2',5'-phosphodiesterase